MVPFGIVCPRAGACSTMLADAPRRTAGVPRRSIVLRHLVSDSSVGGEASRAGPELTWNDVEATRRRWEPWSDGHVVLDAGNDIDANVAEALRDIDQRPDASDPAIRDAIVGVRCLGYSDTASRAGAVALRAGRATSTKGR
jgi:hypothetical protein